MNAWTHSSSWRLWFTCKAPANSQAPLFVMLFPPRLRNVRNNRWEVVQQSSYPFWNLDIPTSQQTKLYRKTNGQNNDDKAKKPTLGSYSIFVNYCNIIAQFHVTKTKVKVVLTSLVPRLSPRPDTISLGWRVSLGTRLHFNYSEHLWYGNVKAGWGWACKWDSMY